MRSRSRSVSLVIAILAAVTMAAPVAAASQWQTFKQVGTNAFAFADSCSENADDTVTCRGQFVDVFEGTISQTGEPTFTGEQVCYSEHSVTFDPTTGEPLESSGRFGCTLGGDTITIRRLASVTLAPTVIELVESACDETGCTETPAGSITVHGTWTGVGQTTSLRGRFQFDDGTCMEVNADRSTSRAATFLGSIDVLDARIAKGSFTFKTTCPH